jgi:NAD(P)-dependent dehydrogenase (short-subunit alcohol dehydrogenase family)
MKINPGRVALVTGSTAGIGFATAKALAAAGATIIVNGRTKTSVDKAVTNIRESVPTVNAIGIDDWRRLFEINVLSGIRLARLYGENMRRRGWGRIVFVSSESGLLTPVDMIHYGVSKTAQIAVARGLAVELAGSGVTVNSVLPGPTSTEGMIAMIADESLRSGRSAEDLEREFFDQARPTSLIRRFSTTDEIAAMIAFVCSEVASSTTGASLRCDGGIVTGLG